MNDAPAWSSEVDLPPLAVDVPEWLFVGAVVYDTDRSCWGQVQDLGWPPDDRQRDRAWLRPPGGGREWNPRIRHLSPAPPAPTTAPRPGDPPP